MSTLLFNAEDIAENFSEVYVERGQAYQRQGSVLQIKLSPDGTKVQSKVQGTQKKPYHVNVSIVADNDNVWLDGTCTCHIGYNCKHVTASLWQLLADQATASLSPRQAATRIASDESSENLLYLMTQQLINEHLLLQVEPCWVRRLKQGDYGKPRPFSDLSLQQRNALLSDQDKQILSWLDFAGVQSEYESGTRFPLIGNNGVEILLQLLQTRRCHWVTPSNPALKLAGARKAHLEWGMEPNGLQRLHCRVDGEPYPVLAVTPPWYLDLKRHECGEMETGLEPAVATALLSAPALKPEQIKRIHAALKHRSDLVSSTSLPTTQTVCHRDVTPIPCLRLRYIDVELKPTLDTSWHAFSKKVPLAELSFLYGQARILSDAPDASVSYIEDQALITMSRRSQDEEQAIQRLIELGLEPLKDQVELVLKDRYETSSWLINSNTDPQYLLDFSVQQLPKLRAAGWQIDVDVSYPFRLVEMEDADWYSKIEEPSGHDWFNLELGIQLHGERINVLPLLLQIIQKMHAGFSANLIQAIPDHTHLIAHLPDGRILPIPIERVRTILSVLTELYDGESLSYDNKLRLSRLRAAQLLELEAAMGAARFRWIGGENLRKLGKKLRQFKGIKTVSPPSDFKADLRPYQQAGLDWLQFLREYDLSGILADDMGLGKTIQTLAHIAVEKQSGRMDKPCLVVAPTSLMLNWRAEVQRFAPHLRVLTLHGSERKPNFSKIPSHDVVLTTYPLLVRDKEALIAESYYLLILDEAQVIKNPKAKATQIVHQLTARHRLCLTGTPMENHLGELWSLFHFLLPGLLGEYRQFNRLFRTPIEINNDLERKASLSKRIAPFMLRRKKQAVLLDLPPKTDIICNVELEDVQRGLYESIRISMHQKILEAINDKGFERSQIMILDALLKLRQTCCDPRLLKLEAAKKQTIGSAKLKLLMDMLPNLIEEGRHVLLFSQFTEMLELIEIELMARQIAYVKLTGKTVDRATPIEVFQSGKVPLFLISLKAGGTGLNLTTADTVIHYDPWWNPAVENQATDRAHRIGQEKSVFVYKLMALGTVEERILAMQEKKQALMEGLFSEDAIPKAGLAAEDLLALFQPLNELE